jgi:hypothetical protein
MGKGLYGCVQGNETRAAGRHNGAVIAQEAMEEHELCVAGILTAWTGFWQLKAFDSLELDIQRVRKLWLESYWPGGDLTYSQHENLVERKIKGLTAQATFGDPGKGARRRRG